MPLAPGEAYGNRRAPLPSAVLTTVSELARVRAELSGRLGRAKSRCSNLADSVNTWPPEASARCDSPATHAEQQGNRTWARFTESSCSEKSPCRLRSVRAHPVPVAPLRPRPSQKAEAARGRVVVPAVRW